MESLKSMLILGREKTSSLTGRREENISTKISKFEADTGKVERIHVFWL